MHAACACWLPMRCDAVANRRRRCQCWAIARWRWESGRLLRRNLIVLIIKRARIRMRLWTMHFSESRLAHRQTTNPIDSIHCTKLTHMNFRNWAIFSTVGHFWEISRNTKLVNFYSKPGRGHTQQFSVDHRECSSIRLYLLFDWAWKRPKMGMCLTLALFTSSHFVFHLSSAGRTSHRKLVFPLSFSLVWKKVRCWPYWAHWRWKIGSTKMKTKDSGCRVAVENNGR